MTAIVGYARTSTLEQVAGFEAQLRELKAMGCTKLFQEQVSSVAKRQQLEACLDYLREGDTLIVTKLDRLARNVAHLGQLVAMLKDKGVRLRVLDLGLDTSTPTGELILNMMGAVAQFERQMMLERQREGIAKAKSEGKYKGRAPTAKRQALRAREMAAEGVSRAEIAARLGVSERSVYRAIKEKNSPHDFV
ncbi:recombinase family protein [Paracoccus liaowanqingii]|uniref:Recombinase family protein n=1 Tax=Paracoccus liaowanqingii TaxID=2560053 RepID=A0A4Z1BTF1_9RHOB|nr:recombinase family protein [Paracoccus liaowanqingii]TGN55491.1 recombinase family protein [Paracoccus liaowanqingii]